MGPDAMILDFWMLNFKPVFLLSCFTFTKRLFSSSSLSSIRWCHLHIWGYWYFSWLPLVAQMVKNLPAMQETWVWSLGWEDPLEEGTAIHSSILAWRIPWTMGWQRVRHDWETFTSLQSWFQFVLHPAWHFLCCTLHTS